MIVLLFKKKSPPVFRRDFDLFYGCLFLLPYNNLRAAELIIVQGNTV